MGKNTSPYCVQLSIYMALFHPEENICACVMSHDDVIVLCGIFIAIIYYTSTATGALTVCVSF